MGQGVYLWALNPIRYRMRTRLTASEEPMSARNGNSSGKSGYIGIYRKVELSGAHA